MKCNFLPLRLKNFLYFTTPTSKFFLEKNFLYFFLKKTSSEKISYIFIYGPKIKNFFIFSFIVREMEFSSPTIKKFLNFTTSNSKFFLEKNFIYIFLEKNPILKKFLIFREMELSSLKLNKLLYFF